MKSETFSQLMYSAEKLQLALEKNPSLINEQDENGQTLLHHAAMAGLVMGSSNISPVLQVLFANSHLDFNVKDNNGNTPVHLAAWNCEDRVTCQYVFPTLVAEAAKRGFDFASLGQHGQSVLQIATRISYTGNSGRINNVENVLNNAPNPAIDAFSSSKSTAFYYAVNHLLFDEANSLLTAGANPALFGSSNRNPVTEIEKYLQKFTEDLSNEDNAYKHDQINEYIARLTDLKEKMAATDAVKDFAEIRKSARLLAQGKRQHSLFATLPDELLHQIAADTKTSDASTQKEAGSMAKEHFKKP